MACEVKINDKPSAIMTEMFQYLEDTAPEDRNAGQVLGIMQRYGVINYFPERDEFHAQKDMEQTLNDMNKAVTSILQTETPLFAYNDRGNYFQIQIRDEDLAQIPTPRSDNYEGTTTGQEAGSVSQPQEDPKTEEYEGEEGPTSAEEATAASAAEREAFAMKEDLDYVTRQIIVNLDKQIDRLQRLSVNSPKAESYIKEIEILQRQMRKVAKGKEQIEDYVDFITYASRVANRSEALVQKIRSEYTETWRTQSPEKRAKTLRTMVELQETIKAFYSSESEQSLMSMLRSKILEMPNKIPEEAQLMMNAIAETDQTMKLISNNYRDTIIPILADYLLSFADMSVNNELDEKIAAIKENRRLIGYSRVDPRHREAKKKGLQAMLDLNIKQLEDKKLGRAMIIKELRETHKDASWFSLYLDPIVHSSDVTLQLFAKAMKDGEVKAFEESLEDKTVMGNAFQAFKAANPHGENNPAVFYQDIIEEINVSKRGADGQYELQKLMSFVQPVDSNKFYLSMHSAYEEAKERWNFPSDPSEFDEYFESADGKGYLQQTGEWYRRNTEAVPDADARFQDMLERQRSLSQEIYQAIQAGEEMKLQYLYLEKNALDDDIQRSRRIIKDDQGRNVMQYTGMLVRPKLRDENGKRLYANAKFEEMPAYAREFYNTAISIYNKSQRKVGRSGLFVNRWEETDFSYILPSIRKTGLDSMYENGAWENIKNNTSDFFTAQETDTEFGELLDASGEKMHFIPRYFTNTIDSKLVSKEVATSMIKFADMANRYEKKADLTGVVGAMQSAIGNRKVKYMTSSGNIRLDRVAQKFGFKIEPFEAKTADGKDSRTYKQLMSFIDNIYYGRSNAHKLEDDLAFASLSKAKMASAARTFTAFSNLSFNTLQATNQLILDHTMGNQEAWAGQFYSKENSAWATRKAYSLGNMLGAVKDTPKFLKANKLTSFMEWADAMQHYGGHFGGETGTGLKKAFGDLDAAFFMQHIPEYQTTATRLLALADSYRGKLKDKQGNVIQVNGRDANLWDVMVRNKNGRLVVDPKVANFNKTDFVSKLHGLIKRTNQIKGSFDKGLAARTWQGQLLLLFKNFFEPGYRKRLGHNAGGAHTDMELGAVTEGYYSTYANLLVSAIRGMANGQSMSSTLAGLTAGEKQNLRRGLQDIFVATAISILHAAVSSIKDDEDKAYMADFLTYQLLRLRAETVQFLNPITYFQMINPVRHMYDLAEQTFVTGMYHTGLAFEEKDVYYQRRQGMFEKGDSKWVKEFLDVMPIARGVFKSRDPESAAKWFELNQ